MTIYNVSIVKLAGSSALVTWSTDEPAQGTVEFGLFTSYGQIYPVNTEFLTSHSLTISGLVEGLTYHIRIRVLDSLANLTLSDDYVFEAITPVISVYPDTVWTPYSSTGQIQVVGGGYGEGPYGEGGYGVGTSVIITVDLNTMWTPFVER